jgi:hypothetical protein
MRVLIVPPRDTWSARRGTAFAAGNRFRGGAEEAEGAEVTAQP